MPCFDCKQLSELSSSPFFSSAEHLSGFQRSELHEGIVFEKNSHFVSRGTLRYRSVSSFAETVAMLLSEFIWNRQVVNGTKSCSSNVIVLPWIDLYLMIGVSEAEKEKQKFELCFLCIFQHSHLPNYIFSSSMYRVIFSSFSHVPIREALQLWFFVQNFWKHTPPFYPEVALFHLALYCLFCTGNSFF